MPIPIPQNPDPFRRLVDIMECLLSPEGCPWDREQSHKTLKPYVVEEAYEMCEAIDDGDMAELRAELGDVGLQVVFHAALARRSGDFDIDDVYTSICDKLIRRHPHVFGETVVDGSGQVLKNWEAIKRAERAEKVSAEERQPSALDGVPKALPALQRAYRLQGKAAKVGFDWPDVGPVFGKIREEFAELEEELGPLVKGASAEKSAKLEGDNKERIADEFGDILFAMVNLARFIGVDPEQALHNTSRKFTRRFHHIEARLAESGRIPAESTLEEMDQYWEEAKKVLGKNPA